MTSETALGLRERQRVARLKPSLNQAYRDILVSQIDSGCVYPLLQRRGFIHSNDSYNK